jgi:hypothetical protein
MSAITIKHRQMTKRDFLILIIKLFGLYAAVTAIFSTLPNNIVFSLGYIDTFVIVWVLATLVITVGLFWILTFKADRLVDLLKLGQGFTDERIELGNIKSEDILKTGTFVIGGLLFIRSVPGLLSNIFWAFRGEIAGLEFTEKDKVNLGVSALNVILGYLLFTNYELVAKRLKGNKAAD